MSLRRHVTRRRMKRRGPLGTVCGLLVACGVTLIGLTVGLEPHVILWRAFISARFVWFTCFVRDECDLRR